MTVTVKFFANVRQLMGKKEITLYLDPSKHYTIKDILKKIAASENKELSTMLLQVQGELRATARIVVSGKEIHFLDGLDTKVQDGDCITIFPLLAGG